ncbi:type VI secretion system contractile sheath large subunit [Stigmatella sp. ncwal1]|uniref:Type VI secretion system contractile sheath large subunit n=1 Tax=Stigmatella ashevillensis TaxID=2995309 RepID=A0ABT5DLI9_9BACT|nr:type VI secretion system contractile sheath large subunit [Stigmatella ashevillena]MDC0713598.1 type VI secretion system contractile sheath large subunit [Stigmatella ashevillena]
MVPLSLIRPVRWLVAGAFLPTPSGHSFVLSESALTERFGHAARRLSVTVRDRIGSSDALLHEVSFATPSAFQLAGVIDALPGLSALRTLHEALSGTRSLSAEELAGLKSTLGPGQLASSMLAALHEARSSQSARRAALAVLEESLFATARDILQSPAVARLESAWRGLHWLWEHSASCTGLEIEVLDVAPHQLMEALTQRLGAEPLQRPDACFITDELDSMEALSPLASLAENAWVPVVACVPTALAGDSSRAAPAPEAWPPEAWNRLRAEESARWLYAALNPVVMGAERQGAVHRECFASPVLAVAALLTASFRDTLTFARLTGPGSGSRAPAVWQPNARSTAATETVLALREQERLASRGLLGVSGCWDSDAVLLGATAPSVHAGRDAAPLPAQILTGRLLRLSEVFAQRLPERPNPEAVASTFTQAAEAFLSLGSGKSCQVHGRVVPTGKTEKGLHVQVSLRPELAGSHLRFEFTLPLR